MKYCTKCGNQVKAQEKFCNKCGAPLQSALAETSGEEHNNSSKSLDSGMDAHQKQTMHSATLFNSDEQKTLGHSSINFPSNLADKLILIGSFVSIIAMFIGAFYADDGGAYAAQVVNGSSLVFNGDYIMGTLLILLPIIVVITQFIDRLKKYDRIISLVCPLVGLAVVMALKNQIGHYADGAMSFAMGAWIYIIGSIIVIIGAGSIFFGINLEEKIKQIKKR